MILNFDIITVFGTLTVPNVTVSGTLTTGQLHVLGTSTLDGPAFFLSGSITMSGYGQGVFINVGVGPMESVLPLPVEYGGTGTVNPFPVGSVVFADTLSNYDSDPNFIWDDTAKTLKLITVSTSNSCLTIKKTEHTSTLPSAFRCFDSIGQETVGFTSWDGGGGGAGYGSVVLSSNASIGAIRLGEISYKSNTNGFRLVSIIGQTGTSNALGEVVVILGTGGGGFGYAQYMGANGTAFKLSTAPTAKVHIAAGSTAASSAPLKMTSGSLMTTAEVGAMEFLTDRLYFTITTGAARKEIALNVSTQNLDNNARLTIRKNTGADVGARRRLNLIEGANVTLTVADDAAGEEVDVTIAASGGGGGGAINSVDVAFTDGDTMRRVTVTDAGVAATSKVMVAVRRPDTTDDSADPGYVYMANVVKVATGSFDALISALGWGFDDPVGKPPSETIKLLYQVAA